MTLLRYLLAATALTLTTIPAHANLFVDGEDKAPSLIAGISLGVPNIHRTFNMTANGKTISGTIDEYVLVNSLSFNLSTVCPSCLDFAFMISVDASSTSSLESFGFGRTNGLITDLDYVNTGGIAPDAANRQIFSGFDAVGFRNTGTHVAPGGTFDLLVIGTNATSSVGNATISVNMDGTPFSSTNANGFQGDFIGPALPTPEPSSVLLLSSAVLAFAAVLRKKKLG